MARDVEIIIGGKKLPLNEFTQEITLNVVTGLLASFKGANVKEEIQIIIRK